MDETKLPAKDETEDEIPVVDELQEDPSRYQDSFIERFNKRLRDGFKALQISGKKDPEARSLDDDLAELDMPDVGEFYEAAHRIEDRDLEPDAD